MHFMSVCRPLTVLCSTTYVYPFKCTRSSLLFTCRLPSKLRTVKIRRMWTRRAFTLWAASSCVTPEDCYSAQKPTGVADSKTQIFWTDLPCVKSWRTRRRRAGCWVRSGVMHVQCRSVKSFLVCCWFTMSCFPGDRRYPLRKWLMTPVDNPESPAEFQYNLAHSATHEIVDRTFRAIQTRFRCLDGTKGYLQVLYCGLFRLYFTSLSLNVTKKEKYQGSKRW